MYTKHDEITSPIQVKPENYVKLNFLEISSNNDVSRWQNDVIIIYFWHNCKYY